MIYGRWGQVVTIVRRAVLADVQALDGRKPDKQDRDALRAGSYVVVKDDGKERLYHQCYLRADGGSLEIADAIIAAEKAVSDPVTCTDCGNRGGHTTEQHRLARQSAAPIKTERSRLYAESAARVMAVCLSEQRSAVAQGRRTPKRAVAIARRKYMSLRSEYLAHDPVDQSEEDWAQHGPFRGYAAFIKERLGIELKHP